MMFKPKADVKGPDDNECMLGGKKVKLGRHRCENVVGKTAETEVSCL